MAIIDYFKQLDERAKITFRNAVLELTGMSYSTFYYKIRNNGFTKLETDAISNMIKEYAGKN